MYIFWIMIYTAVPIMSFFGVIGLLGEEAERAAWHFTIALVTGILVIIAGIATYLGLSYIGIVV